MSDSNRFDPRQHQIKSILTMVRQMGYSINNNSMVVPLAKECERLMAVVETLEAEIVTLTEKLEAAAKPVAKKEKTDGDATTE